MKSNNTINRFKNKTTYIIGLLIIVSFLYFIFMPKSEIKQGNEETQSTDFFKLDGELTFINSNNSFIKKINIEIADNDRTRTLGLMYRDKMNDEQGMLFIFDSVQPLSFWMKNTMIPLDIMFVDKDFQIINIHKETTPYSEQSYQSDKAGLYVVEVKGGFSDRYGIKKGDKISFNRISSPL